MASKWKIQSLEPVLGGRTRTVLSETKYPEVGAVEAERHWVVLGNQRELLRVPEPTDNHIPFGRFAFSPDESRLFALRKIAAGANEVYLFRCVNGPRYSLVDKKPLNQRLVEKFGRPRTEPGSEPAELVLPQSWLSEKELLLTCRYFSSNRHVSVDYQVTLDAHTGHLRHWMPIHRERALGWPQKFERYPQTRLRPMTWREVEGWSDAELAYAINEMYARRRYSFNDQPKMKAQFEGLGFYPDLKMTKETIRSLMWPTERQNLELLRCRSLLKPKRKSA